MKLDGKNKLDFQLEHVLLLASKTCLRLFILFFNMECKHNFKEGSQRLKYC